MIDYRHIIDAATWDFIAKTEAHYPDDAVTSSIEDQRAVYDAMCAAFHVGYPTGVTATDQQIGDVPTRHYTTGPNANPIVQYMHGGGFVVGGLHSHDDVCAEICAATGLDVVAVDYRLSPEHAHPAAIDDSQTVFDQIKGQGIVLCGDSAGGNLAAALAHTNRAADILGQVLIYPGLGGDVNTGSYLRHANAPMLTRDDILFYQDIRGSKATGDLRAAPLLDSSFAELPPTLAIAAECDPLADDPRVYRDLIQSAGGTAIFIEEPGLVHGFLRARHSVPRARASFARITRAIAGMARRQNLAEIALS